MRTGAIILCGGKSSRMGRDKAILPFGPELMLQRVVRLVAEVVPEDRIVVVAGANQALPELPAKIIVGRDAAPHQGPLSGLAHGFRILSDSAGAVYATGCDAPLLVPAFIASMFTQLGCNDAVVPVDCGHYHALAAVYRPSVLPKVEALLRADLRRARDLFSTIPTKKVPVDALRDVDPQLVTLANINTELDYIAALTAAGIAPPD